MTLPDIGSSLPEVVLRTAVVYLFLVVVLRLISGKREVGQMSILELIVILIISDAVQNSMVGENSTLWGGLVAVLTLLAMDFGLKALSLAVATRPPGRRGRAAPARPRRPAARQGPARGRRRSRAGPGRRPLAGHRPRRGGPAGRAGDRRLDQRDPDDGRASTGA